MLSGKRTDIKLIDELPQDEFLIVGDTHGSVEEVRAFLDYRRDDDNVVKVFAGDLLDRGFDSPGVIKAIQTAMEQGEKVYAIRGNHEDMFLKYMQVKDQEGERAANFRNHYFKNGGDWVNYCSNETLAEIQAFLMTLPYLIHVRKHSDGEARFNVIHAAMPFTDTELEDKIQRGDLTLSEEDIFYATWARLCDKTLTRQRGDFNSIPVICGHDKNGPRIRKDNSINLDNGCFECKHLLVLNMKDGTCKVFDKHGLLEAGRTANKSTRDRKRQRSIEQHFKHLPVRNCDVTQLDQHLRDTIPLEIMDAQSRKEHYLKSLKSVRRYLTPEKRETFALYLLRSEKHLLKLERHSVLKLLFDKDSYSNQTLSMLKAVELLLGKEKLRTTEDNQCVVVNDGDRGRFILSRHV